MLAPHLFHPTRCEPPVPTRTVSYLSTQTTTTNEAGTTWAGVSIGTPHPRRCVVLAVYHGVAAACNASVNNITWHWRTQNTTHEFSLFLCQVPTGTTADILVSSASSIRKAVSVYVIYPQSWLPLDDGRVSANTTTDANLADLQVQAQGSLIYSGGQHATLGTFTTTWNGADAVTENVDAQLESAASYTMGHINITASTSVSDLNMAESASGTKRLCATTFGPPMPGGGGAF